MTNKKPKAQTLSFRAMQKAHQSLYGYSPDVDLWDVWDKTTLTRHKGLTYKQARALQTELGDAIIIHDQH